jgi:hypothetical protein
MHLEDRGLLFDATTKPAAQRIAFFTSLFPTGAGTLLAGFQNGPTKNAVTSTIRLCRSRDNGAIWEELPARFETTFEGVPGSLSAGEMVEVEPGKLLLFATWVDRSEPHRPFFDPVTEGVLHTKQLRAYSTNEGDSWSPWEELPIPGLTGCAITGPPVHWPDGTLGYAFESFKEFDDPRPGRHGAWLLLSRDGGRSFHERHLVAQHPEHKIYYWDQRLTPARADGEYIALFWTHDLEQKKDLRVHLRWGSIYDPDDQRTPIVETSIPGQIAAPLLLEDGRLLAFVVDRGQPGTMRLWSSRDGGLTWPESDSLLVHTHDERAVLSQGTENIDFRQYWEDMGKWSFGHPAIRALGADHVLVAFYAGTPTCMSIHWTRINTR